MITKSFVVGVYEDAMLTEQYERERRVMFFVNIFALLSWSAYCWAMGMHWGVSLFGQERVFQ